MRGRFRIHRSISLTRSLHNISVVQGKGEADTSGTDDVAGVVGVMLHATADRLSIGTLTLPEATGFKTPATRLCPTSCQLRQLHREKARSSNAARRPPPAARRPPPAARRPPPAARRPPPAARRPPPAARRPPPAARRPPPAARRPPPAARRLIPKNTRTRT